MPRLFRQFSSAIAVSYTHLVNRDIIREYVDSGRKRGLKVGLYHSVIDWHHPSYDNTICPDLCYPCLLYTSRCV